MKNNVHMICTYIVGSLRMACACEKVGKRGFPDVGETGGTIDAAAYCVRIDEQHALPLGG